MPEKTMKSNKSIILLRSFSILCVLVVVLSCFSFSTSASVSEILDYNDYIYDIQADGENDIVYVRIPVDKFSWISWNEYDISSGSSTTRSDDDPGDSISITFRPGYYYAIRLYPLYLAHLGLDNIPEGTVFDMSFRWDWDLPTDETYIMDMNPRIVPSIQYYDSFGKKLWYYVASDYGDDFGPPGEELHLYLTYKQSSLVSTVPSSCDPRFQLTYYFYEGTYSEPVTTNIQITSFTIQMSISSLYREQQQNDKSNALLAEVNRQLGEQGKTMEDILNQQEQTNDKLDQLPGQIGDEMQGVIESEKEESKGEGNKFVDQILDALPDPSTDVLAALKSLTDATAYTGTDAVLPIPAIVLPGIDGLFPETVIWEGTEFDFGDYLGFIPSSLLTLVQSLFTIAIVLFCVYELKGIISYCLTLRESKGG